MLWERGPRGFLSPEWKWFLFRGVLIGIVAFGVSNALSFIPIADVYGIMFSVPFLSVALSVLLLKEYVGRHRWLSIIIGFIGVLILVGPQYEALNIGLFYTSIAAISGAFSILVLRKIGKKHYMPLLILYSYLGVAAVNIPMALPDLVIPSAHSLYFFFAGSVLLLLGTCATTYGLAHARSTASVAPFIYIQAIWGVILGYIFFGDLPTPPTLIGLIIIIGAGIYMLYNEKQLGKKHLSLKE